MFILTFCVIFILAWGVTKSSHTLPFSITKTIILGGGAFFFYLIGLASFWTGGLGLTLAIVAAAHRYFSPRHPIFATPYIVGLAILLASWGVRQGSTLPFILLLPELLDLTLMMGERIFGVALDSKRFLCRLVTLSGEPFKKRLSVHVLLLFLGGGLVGLSKYPVPIFILAVLAVIFISAATEKKDEKA